MGLQGGEQYDADEESNNGNGVQTVTVMVGWVGDGSKLWR